MRLPKYARELAFFGLREAKVLIERWRRHHYTVRPHSGAWAIAPPGKGLVGSRLFRGT